MWKERIFFRKGNERQSQTASGSWPRSKHCRGEAEMEGCLALNQEPWLNSMHCNNQGHWDLLKHHHEELHFREKSFSVTHLCHNKAAPVNHRVYFYIENFVISIGKLVWYTVFYRIMMAHDGFLSKWIFLLFRVTCLFREILGAYPELEDSGTQSSLIKFCTKSRFFLFALQDGGMAGVFGCSHCLVHVSPHKRPYLLN